MGSIWVLVPLKDPSNIFSLPLYPDFWFVTLAILKGAIQIKLLSEMSEMVCSYAVSRLSFQGFLNSLAWRYPDGTTCLKMFLKKSFFFLLCICTWWVSPSISHSVHCAALKGTQQEAKLIRKHQIWYRRGQFLNFSTGTVAWSWHSAGHPPGEVIGPWSN